MKITFEVQEKLNPQSGYKQHTWDLSQQLDVDLFMEMNPEFKFSKVATVVPKNNACGFRLDYIDPTFEQNKFILYFIVLDNKILKGGRTATGLSSRFGTYGTGTPNLWANSPTVAATSYVYSQVFRKMLEEGKEVSFYGFVCPEITAEFDVFGTTHTIKVSPEKEFEKALNTKLRNTLGRKPIGDGNLLQQHKI